MEHVKESIIISILYYFYCYYYFYYRYYYHYYFYYNYYYYYYYYYYYSITNLIQNQAVGRMIPVIESQDIVPFSDEQECRIKLKIMC